MMHLLHISRFIPYVYIPHAIRFYQFEFVLLSLFSPFVFAFLTLQPATAYGCAFLKMDLLVVFSCYNKILFPIVANFFAHSELFGCWSFLCGTTVFLPYIIKRFETTVVNNLPNNVHIPLCATKKTLQDTDVGFLQCSVKSGTRTLTCGGIRSGFVALPAGSWSDKDFKSFRGQVKTLGSGM